MAKPKHLLDKYTFFEFQSNFRFLLLSLLGTFILNGCSPMGRQAAVLLAENTTESVACKAAESYFFNSLIRMLQEEGQFPPSNVVREALKENLQREFDLGHFKTSNENSLDLFLGHFMKFYDLVSVDMSQKLQLKGINEIIAALSALEIGDQTSQEKEKLQFQWQKIKGPLLKSVKNLEALDSKGTCNEDPNFPHEDAESENPDGGLPQTPPDSGDLEPISLLDALKKTHPAPVYGAMKTLAVAYQSCEVLNLKPMDANSPSVVGVQVYGKHSNGAGNLRRIASLADVIRTHFYIKGQFPPSNSQCAQLNESPLIYDYGGKPSASSSMDSPLDFFRNAGTGGPGLGTDCSGYVFTAYATAGLKLREDQPLKAVQVFGVSAGMIKNPKGNGLSCLEVTDDGLNPGDLIASSGHIVLVDAVGQDPWGVNQFTNISQCQLNAMESDRFNFVISQSSPSKGAIGINRMLAADYFSTSSTMREGLKNYALSACKKRFGVILTGANTFVSIVRHKGTASCKAPPLNLVNQDCLASCQMAEL